MTTTFNHDPLPEDEYALVECYCPDPTCDCRRVMLNAPSQRQRGFLAMISFGVDRDQELADPFLDPLNPQSQCAGTFLELLKHVLSDPSCCARLEQHYYQAKRAAANPTLAIQEVLSRLSPDNAWSAGRGKKRKRSKRRKTRRNDGNRVDTGCTGQQFPMRLKPFIRWEGLFQRGLCYSQ